MSVILREKWIDPWLDPTIALNEMLRVFDPYPEKKMLYYPVSRFVNSPKNEGLEYWARVEV